MIPEISITCSTGKIFINSITVEQYKKYVALMEKNGSDRITDAMFFNKKITQEIFGNRMSLEELGEADAVEFLTAAKGIHFIMQSIISQKLLNTDGKCERCCTRPVMCGLCDYDSERRCNG